MLALARNLPEYEWDAFARRVERIQVKAPAADAEAALQQEVGQTLA